MKMRAQISISGSIVAIVISVPLIGCTAIGTGHNTVVLATRPAAAVYNGPEFDDLLVGGDGRQFISDSDPAKELPRWAKYKSAYTRAESGARIDLTIRDLNITPPLDPLNIEGTNASDIVKIMSDSTTTSEQKATLVRQLRDNYRRMPENYLPLVSRLEDVVVREFGDDKNQKPQDDTNQKTESVTLYHYFPKIAFDLTGELETVGSKDRFDFLAVAIRLKNDVPSGVRFANFTPKLADLFDFSLGTLQQTAAATGTASAGLTGATKVTGTSTPEAGSTAGSELDAGTSYGGSASFTLTDQLTRDLKSDLDTRSAGIVDDGRAFIVELRSNEQHRVAGTYSYSVMLDIPSTATRYKKVSGTYIESTPIAQDLSVEVRLIGVIRHVAKMGMTGTFKKAPESTNDDTFDEVLLSEKVLPLWHLHQPVMVDTQADKKQTTLVVYTNHDAASFTVYSDDAQHNVLGRGKGRESSFALNEKKSVNIEFDPIIVSGNKPAALTAPAVKHVAIDPEKKVQVISDYMPTAGKDENRHGH